MPFSDQPMSEDFFDPEDEFEILDEDFDDLEVEDFNIEDDEED